MSCAACTEQTRDYTEVVEVLDKYHREPSKVIPILQDIQAIFRYLPGDVMEFVAKEMKLSSAKVYGISTFYSHFSLEEKGKYVLKVCDGTACHVKGSTKLIGAFQEKLDLNDDKPTSDDKLFSLETVSCLGACGLAPAVVVNEDVHGQVVPKAAIELIDKIKTKEAEND